MCYYIQYFFLLKCHKNVDDQCKNKILFVWFLPILVYKVEVICEHSRINVVCLPRTEPRTERFKDNHESQ